MDSNETARLIMSLFVTVCAGVGVFGVWHILYESLAKAYCICGHEFNQHYVLPRGHKPEFYGIPAGEPCKVCSCKKFRKNDKDSRNSK